MSDEFDDLPQPVAANDKPRTNHAARGAPLSRIPELVAEVYRGATSPLRAGLLECLLRPVGPLALVAIAAGAFGELLRRGGYRRLSVSPDDATRITSDQIFELARYVEQCNPETFQQIASLLADNPVGIAGMGGTLLLLALQAWRQRHSAGAS